MLNSYSERYLDTEIGEKNHLSHVGIWGVVFGLEVFLLLLIANTLVCLYCDHWTMLKSTTQLFVVSSWRYSPCFEGFIYDSFQV